MTELNPKDLIVQTFLAEYQTRSQWSYGYPVGVRIAHLPTGLSYSCEKHTSQHKNKAIAIEVLQRKVQDYYIEHEHPEDLGFPEECVKDGRFFVEDGQGDIGEWDWVVKDSESINEPVAAFLNKGMAEEYCDFMNNKEK